MRLCWLLVAIVVELTAQPAFDSERTLSVFLDRMRETLEHQPDYTCLETIERTRRAPGGNTQVEDTLRLEVALVDSKEMFAWPGSKQFEDKELTELVTSGTFGNGNFALYPRMLFGGGGPAFVYAGEVEVNGRKTAQYNFRVVQAMSGYHLAMNRQKAIVGFHGSFYVDSETLDLRRLVIIPDDIPVSLRLTATEDRVDYDRVKIGEERFLLPVESRLMMATPESVSRNRVRFTGCRKFTGESTLLFFEDDVPDSAAPAAAEIAEVTLPAGTEVKLTLTSDLVLAEGAVGDVIEAKLSSDVKVAKRVLAPKGAIARGRVVKLERQQDFFVVILRFMDLEWKGGHAHLNLKFENLNSGIAGARQTFFRGVAGDDILIRRGGPKRLKDILTYWSVQP